MPALGFNIRRRRVGVGVGVTCSMRKLMTALAVILALYFALLLSTLGSSIPIDTPVRPRIDIGTSRTGVNKAASSSARDTSSGLKDENIITIGIASTITACGTDRFTEGAAVLKYSIDLTSINGSKGGKYNYKMYILHHPDALECALPLKDLGFELLERPTPVNVSAIQGDVLRERIVRNGCCGEKELIKLEAFRLVQHPIVIHLDLDVLVMKPMDPAIDLMLYPDRASTININSFVMWPKQPIPNQISLMYTKDYNVVAPRRRDKPFQGGFFMIKPSLDTYTEFVNIVREGDYIDLPRAKGWGGKVGPFHGGMTIQGLLPWYYEYLHPGQAVELNRCAYNNMADNPTMEISVNDTAQGRCRTNEEVLQIVERCIEDGKADPHTVISGLLLQQCEDCRLRNINDIVTFHFTICLKPWTCAPQAKDIIDMRLCYRAHHEWFLYRRSLEMSWRRTGIGPEDYRSDHFLGQCKFAGAAGYHPIGTPYGEV